MKKVILELKINESESLTVYEKNNYAELYRDSVLVYKLESLHTFMDLLAECMKDNLELCVTRTEPNTFEMDYGFIGCNNKELYLAQYQNGYALLVVKFTEERNCDPKMKLIKTIFIDSNTFQTWQENIKSAFEQRHVSESGRSREELEEFFEFMRTPTADWSKWYGVDENTSNSN